MVALRLFDVMNACLDIPKYTDDEFISSQLPLSSHLIAFMVAQGVSTCASSIWLNTCEDGTLGYGYGTTRASEAIVGLPMIVNGARRDAAALNVTN